MRKKLILLDIDNTLYDSSSFRKQLFSEVVKILEKEDIINAALLCEEVYSGLITEKGLFYPEDFIEALEKKLPNNTISKQALLTVMYDEGFVSSYLYQETHAVVKEFDQLGKLGIFSQGIARFQSLKVKQIAHLVKKHHMHFVENKLSSFQEIFNSYKDYEIFFLDDALPVLHAVKQTYPSVFTIWIKRGRYALNQQPIANFVPDATVETLEQAKKVVQSN